MSHMMSHVKEEEWLFIGIQMEDHLQFSMQMSPLKDTLRECLYSWYAFLCFNGLKSFDIFFICHNNIGDMSHTPINEYVTYE